MQGVMCFKQREKVVNSVHKKDGKQTLKYYRRILLLFVEKIFERSLCN